MSNDDSLTINHIKKSHSIHKNTNVKIPELKVKVGNAEMSYSDFKTQKEIEVSKQNKRIKSPINRRLFLQNEINQINLKNNEQINDNKMKSEDIFIIDKEIYSPRKTKKSILKRESTTLTQNFEQKKSVKFAGNNNEEPLETVIIIPKNDENSKDIKENDNKNNDENANCACSCSIF